MMRLSLKILAVLVFAVCAAPGLAYAEAVEISNGADALSNLQPLDSGALQGYAGGTGISINNTSVAQATAISKDNSIQGGIGATGGISSNSLSGNSGLTTLIANTGNQVSISQSTVVNVFLQ